MARSHRLRRRGTGRHYLRWLRRRILTPGRQPRAAGPSQGLPPQLAGAQEHLREDGMTGPGAAGRRSVAWRLAAISLAGAAVTGALYVAGRLHTPNYTFSLFGQTGLAAVTLKSLLASLVLGLAALQVLLALWIYRKLPLAGSPPRPVRPAHRITGFALFALTVPIAVHCLLAYGVQLTTARVAVHSLAGCFFYGAFTAKVLLVQSRRLPGWALPAAGGALAILVAVLWYTSALWYYNGYQLPAI